MKSLSIDLSYIRDKELASFKKSTVHLLGQTEKMKALTDKFSHA